MNKLKSTDFVEERLRAEPDSKLWQRWREMIETARAEEVPPFPRTLLVEVANICNHGCSFCAYTKMTRPKQYIDPELFRDLVRQAYDLGAREIGLHGGSEPLTCKKLEEHVAFCAEAGYEYIYFSTNGGLGTPERFKRLIDAGTSSIKFSVNGGDAEAYRRIHGRDEFDKVAENIRFVAEYRKTLDRPLYLSISFVEVPENADSFATLKETFGDLVDEIFHVPAINQSGQMNDLPTSPYQAELCQVPFNQANITREGYLRACCNDYQNMLALEDLRTVSLAEAWGGERFRDLRRRHMEDRLEGTLCHSCTRGCASPARPLNPALGDWGQIE